MRVHSLRPLGRGLNNWRARSTVRGVTVYDHCAELSCGSATRHRSTTAPRSTLQERLRAARQQELIPDTLLLLEHNPRVYTRGRRSAPGELTMGEAWYARRGSRSSTTNRGGKVTYHGPGQLVGYPIVRVDDVVAYVRLLEQALVERARREGHRCARATRRGPRLHRRLGRGPQDRLDRRARRAGVTTHGFAVNVDNDLTPFSWVVACGLPERDDDLDRGRPAPPTGGDAVGFQATARALALARPRRPASCFRQRAASRWPGARHRQRLVTRERRPSAAPQTW